MQCAMRVPGNSQHTVEVLSQPHKIHPSVKCSRRTAKIMKQPENSVTLALGSISSKKCIISKCQIDCLWSVFDNLHESTLTIPLTPPMSNGLLPSLSTTRTATPVMINYSNKTITSLEDRKFRTTMYFGHHVSKSYSEIVRADFPR
jgi:hypothetical protein